MMEENKVSNIKLRFEGQGEAVTNQNNDSNNYTQGSQDVSISTKGKTGNIREKYSKVFSELEQKYKVKEDSKSNNDATKRSISQTEKTDVPNAILSNDTNTKIPGIPMPPPPYSMMQKFNKIKLDTKVGTPMQIKICTKAGIPTIIEINVPVDTDIEINTNPSILGIQSTNKDITSDNYCTDSSESDSGHYPLSGSASDSFCCAKIW